MVGRSIVIELENVWKEAVVGYTGTGPDCTEENHKVPQRQYSVLGPRFKSDTNIQLSMRCALSQHIRVDIAIAKVQKTNPTLC